jgi:hypothetical protein
VHTVPHILRKQKFIFEELPTTEKNVNYFNNLPTVAKTHLRAIVKLLLPFFILCYRACIR